MSVLREGQLLDAADAALLDRWGATHLPECCVVPCTYVLPSGEVTSIAALYLQEGGAA